MRSGFVEPVHLTASQRDGIGTELGRRRKAVFHDPERQSAFLRRVEGALTYLQNATPETESIDSARDRIALLHRRLTDTLAVIAKLNASERSSLKPKGRDALSSVVSNIEALLPGVEGLRMAYGARPYTKPDGRTRFMVEHLASAWRDCFDEVPSNKADGAFFQVINAVLLETGFDEIGRDALRSLLKPSG